MNPIELGKFLANLRNEKNLTQEELAEILFIDKRKVSRWECGTSIPEFEILIKLSEILDVSLYEISICKRIDKEKINRRVLNKFKGIKDFKKYKLKKKLFIIFIFILLIIFGITLTYTIRNQGTVEIYELKSLDEDYSIKGNYIKYKDERLINVLSLENKQNEIKDNGKDCVIEIYDEHNRKIQLNNGNSLNNIINKAHYFNDKNTVNLKMNKLYGISIICNNNSNYNSKKSISFKFKLIKNYDNKLFSFN